MISKYNVIIEGVCLSKKINQNTYQLKFDNVCKIIYWEVFIKNIKTRKSFTKSKKDFVNDFHFTKNELSVVIIYNNNNYYFYIEDVQMKNNHLEITVTNKDVQNNTLFFKKCLPVGCLLQMKLWVDALFVKSDGLPTGPFPSSLSNGGPIPNFTTMPEGSISN